MKLAVTTKNFGEQILHNFFFDFAQIIILQLKYSGSRQI